MIAGRAGGTSTDTTLTGPAQRGAERLLVARREPVIVRQEEDLVQVLRRAVQGGTGAFLVRSEVAGRHEAG
ncbi:MAG: hypothetical protein IRZ08_15175 [Frankia sp.]|nr:hypothetical protein [Frankia sp.]